MDAIYAFSAWLDEKLPCHSNSQMQNRKHQFADVDAIHWDVWRAATQVWGKPSLPTRNKPQAGPSSGRDGPNVLMHEASGIMEQNTHKEDPNVMIEPVNSTVQGGRTPLTQVKQITKVKRLFFGTSPNTIQVHG